MGRRGTYRIGFARALPLLPALLAASIAPAAAKGIVFGGRMGLELDGLGQEYRTLGILDDNIDPGGPIEEQIEERPVRSRETRTLGLLELRIEGGSQDRRWFRLVETGRIGPSRGRSSLLADLGVRAGSDRIRLENQWDYQAGDDEPVPGSQNLLALFWDRDALPLGFRSQVQVGGDWSESKDDSLAALYDYRSLRGQVLIRRRIGSHLEARGQVGARRKAAFRSESASYRSRHAEIELSGSIFLTDRWNLSVRGEDREYDREGLGIPPSRSYWQEARYQAPWRMSLRPFLDQRYQRYEYEGGAGLFQDSGSLRIQAGTDYIPRAGESDAEAADLLLAPHLRLRAAGILDRYRVASAPADTLIATSSYDGYAALVGVAREGGAGETLWFDLSLEVGRRDYHADRRRTQLSFEGVRFSLSTTDYTYVRSTLLAEWRPVPWLRADGFVQWDEELHSESADNFRLWILNASLTYPF